MSLLALAAIGACADPAPATNTASQAIVDQHVDAQVVLPAGVQFADVFVGAADGLSIESQSLLDRAGHLALITNAGSSDSRLYASSGVRAVLISEGHVELGAGAVLDGSVRTSIPLSVDPSAVITGDVVEDAVLTPPLELSAPVHFAASTTQVVASTGIVTTLTPDA
jgi:hypothetical protein